MESEDEFHGVYKHFESLGFFVGYQISELSEAAVIEVGHIKHTASKRTDTIYSGILLFPILLKLRRWMIALVITSYVSLELIRSVALNAHSNDGALWRFNLACSASDGGKSTIVF